MAGTPDAALSPQATGPMRGGKVQPAVRSSLPEMHRLPGGSMAPDRVHLVALPLVRSSA